jgi:protein SCO1/2
MAFSLPSVIRSLGRTSQVPWTALERGSIRPLSQALRSQTRPQYLSTTTRSYTHRSQSPSHRNHNGFPHLYRPFTTSSFRAAKTMGQLKARHSTGPFSWKAALLFVLTGASLVAYFRFEKARLERKRVVEMSKGVGKPKVGGPFVLKDLDGKEFSHEDLKGKYSFVCDIRPVSCFRRYVKC